PQYRPHTRTTRFPYTTLFRSSKGIDQQAADHRADDGGDAGEPGPGTDGRGPVVGVEARLEDGEAARRQKSPAHALQDPGGHQPADRKSTRLHSSHVKISYAVF